MMQLLELGIQVAGKICVVLPLLVEVARRIVAVLM